MKKVIIYARVSTKDQSTESQLLKLEEYCKNHDYLIVAKYEDIGTGKNTKRENYQKLLDEIHLKSFDILLVWKLNRLSRNTKELIELSEKLTHKNIDLITYNEKIDTSTPTGKLFFNIIAVIAEFERENIVENIKSGMDKARAKGVRIGRPPTNKEKFTDKLLSIAQSMKLSGKSYRTIAKDLNIKNHSALYQALKEFETDTNRQKNIFDFIEK